MDLIVLNIFDFEIDIFYRVFACNHPCSVFEFNTTTIHRASITNDPTRHSKFVFHLGFKTPLQIVN